MAEIIQTLRNSILNGRSVAKNFFGGSLFLVTREEIDTKDYIWVPDESSTRLFEDLRQLSDVESYDIDGIKAVVIRNITILDPNKFMGPRLRKSLLTRACKGYIKSSVGLFDLKGNEVEVPKNLDDGIDNCTVDLLEVFGILHITSIPSSIEVEGVNTSKGWETNFTSVCDLAKKVANALSGDKNFTIPFAKSESKSSNTMFARLLIYHALERHKMLLWAKDHVKQTWNMSKTCVEDLAKNWGAEGRFQQLLLRGLYHAILRMSENPRILDFIPNSVMQSSADIKKNHFPSFKKHERDSLRGGKAKNGGIGVIKVSVDVYHPDSIRFLLPKERSEIRAISKEIEKPNSKEFDETEPFKRDYASFNRLVIDTVSVMAPFYYRIRKIARSRMYAIKTIRTILKVSEHIDDSDFNKDNLLEDVTTLASTLEQNEKTGALISEASLTLTTEILLNMKNTIKQ